MYENFARCLMFENATCIGVVRFTTSSIHLQQPYKIPSLRLVGLRGNYYLAPYFGKHMI
jgi:hypothetical protein